MQNNVFYIDNVDGCRYLQIIGAGAYDAKVHAKTVELQKIFKTLTNK